MWFIGPQRKEKLKEMFNSSNNCMILKKKKNNDSKLNSFYSILIYFIFKSFIHQLHFRFTVKLKRLQRYRNNHIHYYPFAL